MKPFDIFSNLPDQDSKTTRRFEDLSPEQQGVAEQMIRDAETSQIHNALSMVSEAVNKVQNVFGGIESDDLVIDFDPESGRSNWFVNRGLLEDAKSEEADLGQAEKEYQYYGRLADDEEGNQIYGFDYIRSVAATEE